MSIVYEQLFASRLREVVAATMALDRAQANKATLEVKRKGSVSENADRKARLARFDSELAGLRDTLKQFGTPPKPVTKWVLIYNRHGQVTGQRPVTTTPPWSGATMQSNTWLKRSATNCPRALERSGLRPRDQIAQTDEAVTAANNQRMAKVAEANAFLCGDDLLKSPMRSPKKRCSRPSRVRPARRIRNRSRCQSGGLRLIHTILHHR
jgi:hypothetical protein